MIGNIIPAVNSTNSFFAACLINEIVKFFSFKDENNDCKLYEPMMYTYM